MTTHVTAPRFRASSRNENIRDGLEGVDALASRFTRLILTLVVWAAEA